VAVGSIADIVVLTEKTTDANVGQPPQFWVESGCAFFVKPEEIE
jgi:hypothetical protein